jgi:hypothetical protein
MNGIKIASIILALGGLSAAIVAARYWWRASRVGIPNTTVSVADVPALHILGTQVAFNESSRLNSTAAVWTGAAAVVSAAASVLGVL